MEHGKRTQYVDVRIYEERRGNNNRLQDLRNREAAMADLKLATAQDINGNW